MDRLPFEVLLQIFEYLPISSYQAIYLIFPQAVVDEALVYKLRNNKSQSVVDLVSTNLHELSATQVNKRNESSLSLYFASFDSSHRFIWTLPDFNHSHHYFRVKDAYVSHGKLIIRGRRNLHDDVIIGQQKQLSSLWDIRKSFPPTRAGSFSGASEYSRIRSQELTIHQSGCILDSCLIPSLSGGGVSNNVVVKVVRLGDKSHNNDDDKEIVGPKRPSLPSNYIRKVSTSTSYWIPSTYPDPICGYFLVERLAISIPTFLDLYS